MKLFVRALALCFLFFSIKANEDESQNDLSKNDLEAVVSQFKNKVIFQILK